MLNHIKYVYHKLQAINKSKSFKKEMKDLINQNSQIPDLTKEEIRQINNKWKKYGYKPDLNAFRWLYYASQIRDCNFITGDFYDRILLPKLCNSYKASVYDDKNKYDLYFPDVKKPETIIHNINGTFMDKNYHVISREDAIIYVKNSDNKIVIKPSINSCCGRNVKLFEPNDIENILNTYDKNFIIQHRVIQHPTFAKFNESSSNVVRITSVFIKNKVYTFSPTIRIGDADRFTDLGGTYEFCVGIDDNGKFKNTGLATKSNIKRSNKTPNGFSFGGIQLPGYQEMIEIIKLLHPRFNEFKIIGWDFITDKDNEVNLIECNLHWPGIFKYQQCNGPLFGVFTDEILDELFK